MTGYRLDFFGTITYIYILSALLGSIYEDRVNVKISFCMVINISEKMRRMLFMKVMKNPK